MAKKKYSSRAQDILDMIRKRQRTNPSPPSHSSSSGRVHSRKLRAILENMGREDQDVDPVETIAHAPLRANDWQEFKRKFVETYGDEKIQPTGMTHGEYMEYIRTSGEREGDEFEDDWYYIRQRLRESKREQSGRNFRRNMNEAFEALAWLDKRKKAKKEKIKNIQTMLKKQAKKDYKDPI